jgi:hypothetical protein
VKKRHGTNTLAYFAAVALTNKKVLYDFLQHYYYTGAHVRITPVIRGGWQCQKCKWCQNCRQANQVSMFIKLFFGVIDTPAE